MPLNIRSNEVDQLAGQLAARTGTNKTAAVKLALQNELARRAAATPWRDRLRDLQQSVLAHPPTGLQADKAFFDWLSSDE